MDGRRGARGVHSPFFFFFFCSPPWKYPAEALGRVLPGSQDVNVNFLPVTEETLPHTPALVPPRPPRHGHQAFQSKEPFFLFPDWCALAIRH